MSVKTIVVEIQGDDVSLTLEEAKKLHKDLDSLFGSKNTTPRYDPNNPFGLPITYQTNGVEYPTSKAESNLIGEITYKTTGKVK